MKKLYGDSELCFPKDQCGLCGMGGADKVPHPVYLPGEERPETDLVHAECEGQETLRAFDALNPKERDNFLNQIVKDCAR
jgi:hypothetical protein